MKVPIIWLKDYVKSEKTAKEIAESFTALGLLLDKPVESVNETEVLDLEHRMDRADWLSILGCARDFAAMEKLELQYPLIDKEERQAIPITERVKINVIGTGFVNRFYTRIIKNVTISESPDWLKKRLETYGIPSKNNIVDITNFVMVEYGQPMHAHDLDKMTARDITFRQAENGEEITTLLGERLKLDESVWITTTDNKPTGIGGIVGGTEVAIDNNTKNIVLDSGNYDQTLIRRASRKLKIYNETVLRNDKFLHPKNNELAIKRATVLLKQLGGQEIEIYENEDYYPIKWEPKSMIVRLNRIKKVGGVEYSIGEVNETLERLEYKALSVSENKLELEVPYFRTDVVVEDDLVADVLRINNYSNISLVPISSSPPKDITPPIVKFESKLREYLARLGLHEHITDPLVEAKGSQDQVVLQNALTSEKSALRTTIYETLSPVLKTYKKHKIEEIGVFEIGLTYEFTGGNRNSYENYKENRKLEAIYMSKDKAAYELNNKVKEDLSTLFKDLGVVDYYYNATNSETKIFQNDTDLGQIKLDGFVLNTEALLNADTVISRVKSVIPNYSTESFSFVIDKGLSFGPIYEEIKNFSPFIKNVTVVEEFINAKKIGKNKKAILLSVTYESSEGFASVKQDLLDKLEKEYSVAIRK